MDGGGGNVLLWGATGSGKTEVYIRACEAALGRGRGAIVLVPEIALTPQALGRFRERFGDRVAVLHSGLTEAERRDERERIASGEAPVVVGARSAVFAPVRVGRRHLRRRGARRVVQAGVRPALRRAHGRREARRARRRRRRLRLGARRVRRRGSRSSGSSSAGASRRRCRRCASSTFAARPAIRSPRRSSPSSAPIVESDGKAILLLNRRGIAPAVHCRACGATRRCPNCDVALTLHGDERAAAATTAGARSRWGRRAPRAVPPSSRASARERSGSSASSRSICPSSRSSASTRIVDDVREPLERFARTKRAVLVGTQMVAKGHHFAASQLAAVVDADTGLGMPDFRAEERTFQLLTQLAGRSGRDAPGRVLVQTFQPDARSIVHAARHDVSGFLAEELERRRALGYPPFAHLVRIVVTGPEQADAMRALEEMKAGLHGHELLGPAPLLRLRGRHRAQLVGKTDRPRALASRAAALLSAAAPAMRQAGLTAVVDVDPQSL